jgi:hypothetical protein
MSDTHERSGRHPLALKPIVLRPRGTPAIVTRDIGYRTGPSGTLSLDVYRPGGADAVLPAVVLVTGVPDVGAPHPLGCAFKEMAYVESLGQLLAASGLIAAAYTASHPADDAAAVLSYLVKEADNLGIDPTRLALWAMSGHVPLALSLLIDRAASIEAAVLLNGFMFDVDGTAAAAARTYRFTYSIGAHTADDLPSDAALFVVRSGRDEFVGVNETIDRFVVDALRRNLPLTFINHANAPHAFEINDDSTLSRHILREAVAFLQLHLRQETEVAEATER